MRVLVNAVASRSGAGATFLGSFLIDLAQELPDANFDVYVTPDAPSPPDHERLNFHIVKIPRGTSIRRIWWDNVILARRARHFDLVLSPLNFGPTWCKPPHVLFQLNALYFDSTYTRTQPFRVRLKFAAYRRFALVQCNMADQVVVPSKAMGRLIQPRLRNPAKVVVAPHSVDFHWCRAKATLPPPDRAKSWLSRQVRLLHVGTPSSHKGLDVLADTLVLIQSALPHVDIGLAVTCEKDDRSEAVLQFRSRIEKGGLLEQVAWLGKVEHEQVFSLYRSADILLLPSRVESFAYPVLEAMVVGCQVVASDLRAIREIAMGYAALHPVEDAECAAKLVIERLLKQTHESESVAPEYLLKNGISQATILATHLKDLVIKKEHDRPIRWYHFTGAP